jgi:phage terminase large subunit-like protein
MGGMELADFICKSLNMWVRDQDTQYIDPEAWRACGTDRSLAEFVKTGTRECYVGLDLSSGGDLTTLALEFPKADGGYYVHSHSFMPRGRFEEHQQTDLAPYQVWAQAELITLTGGETSFMTDYDYIMGYLHDLRERFGLTFLGIGIDPHNAAGVLQPLERFGCPVVTITQSARNLNEATTAMRLLIKEGNVEYDIANELLTWSMVNAAVVRNSFDEIKIDKKPGARTKRIDPSDAVIDSHALMLQLNGIAGPVDLNQGIDEYFAAMGWQ